LNGDLLRQFREKIQIKNVFLNSREDQLIIAFNYMFQEGDKQIMQGNITVKKLYGLEKVANLSSLVYKETINQLQEQKVITNKYIPCIEAIVLSRQERNFNIFFVKNDP